MKITGPLDRVFVSADHHFGHANIIGYCNRPFSGAWEMDRKMVRAWNDTVGLGDTVYHLGDFTLGVWAEARARFSELAGRVKVLSYPWHHDRRWLGGAEAHLVELLPPMVVLEVPELGDGEHPLAITLCHYPLEVWDRKHFGAWSLHGHSHGNCPEVPRRLDVGVDCHGFRPVSLAEVVDIFREQEEGNVDV
jgi:calcineurin-like phosphoesterase family protein